MACASAALAQNEYLESPTDHGHASYFTWRSSPADGTSIDVTYYIRGPQGNQPVFTPEMEARIRDAAATWNSAGAFVNLVEVSSQALADIWIRPWWRDEPSWNDVNYDPAEGSPLYPDGTPWHQITDAPLGFNVDDFYWYTGSDPNGIGPGQLDFQSYVLHELGHALGLGTAVPSDGSSIMYAPPPPGTTSRIPSADDRAALGLLYGTPEPATFVLFGIGLVAVGAAWKSRRRPVHVG